MPDDVETSYPPEASRVPAPVADWDWRPARLVVVFLLILIVACFWPLLGFFFSQDDFTLLSWALNNPGKRLGQAFGDIPHHFRPLTKTVYFATASRLFGMNALPFHVVSLVVHLLNTILVFALLRRMRAGDAPAAVGAALFGLSASFVHAIGWISCIQQLGGALFMLSSVCLTLGARERWTSSRVWGAALLYALALMSNEQTLAAPAVAAAMALAIAGRPRPVVTVLKTTWPQFVLLIAYILMRFAWKGLPEEGTSQFRFGENMIVNAFQYGGGLYDFWPMIAGLIPYRRFHFEITHILLAGVIAYNLLRARFAVVAIALAWVAGSLAPALPLQGHYFYYHLYIPTFGGVLLLSFLLRDGLDLLGWSRLRSPAFRTTVIVAAVTAIAILSAGRVRHNVRVVKDTDTRMKGSFVLRRALIAENVWRELPSFSAELEGAEKLRLAHGSTRDPLEPPQTSDVNWALGRGKAINLRLGRPDLEVAIGTMAFGRATGSSVVLCYDNYGHLYRLDDVTEARRRGMEDESREEPQQKEPRR